MKLNFKLSLFSNKIINLWLILLFFTDLFFSFLTCLLKPNAFSSIFFFLLLFTSFIIFIGIITSKKLQKKQLDTVQLFLKNPDVKTIQQLIQVTDSNWYPIIQQLSIQLEQQMKEINEKQLELKNYQEFIEAWVHEIKTPLSLITLLLENHKNELSPYMFHRFQHVKHVISMDVERILYYAQLQADHIDLKFETLNLSECIHECLKDFQSIAEEKTIKIEQKLINVQIISDKKVLCFIISQIFSNAFKYTAKKNGIVQISSWMDSNTKTDQKIHLIIRDNGVGIPPEDKPFLFDKGFTGSHPKRQNATGMGLYLVQKFAKSLSIEVEIEEFSIKGNGFGIELKFPIV